jgi:predicted regulator of Ras-like GTPase activity (Roadblock/LC7/MglB family)
MNRDPHTIALHNALTEIKKAYPGIHHSFLFTNNGSIVTGDPETEEETVKNMLESFEDLKEKTKAIGNLKSFTINAKNGKITASSIDDMYLVLATSEKIDETKIYSITHVIIPTILKTMKTFDSPHLQEPSTKKLVVDTLSGFFAGDSVQIDGETLMDWTKNIDPRARVKAALTEEQNPQESIDHVRIETFSGNSTLCKVKEITDQKLKGKNMIRIPEKLCNTLEIKKGDLVKVKPM